MRASVPVQADVAHNALVATVQLYSEMLQAYQQNIEAMVARHLQSLNDTQVRHQHALDAAAKQLDEANRRCRELETELALWQAKGV